MNNKKIYFTFLITTYCAFSSLAQMNLKESNPTKNVKKVVEVLANLPQKSIQLIKGQKIKIADFQSQEKAKITLSDVSGKVVLQEDIFAYNPLSSNIDLNSGTYFLSISVDERQSVKSILIVNNF